MEAQRRDVQGNIRLALIRGQVLKTYKTKAGVGRKSVTVGPYHKAVGARSYALIVGGETFECGTAIEAAQEFIAYVGRNDAWDALHGRGRKRNPE